MTTLHGKAYAEAQKVARQRFRRIKLLRRSMNMSQLDLSDASGVPLSTLNRMGIGGSLYDEHLAKVASALGVSPDLIRHGFKKGAVHENRHKLLGRTTKQEESLVIMYRNLSGAGKKEASRVLMEMLDCEDQ